ncbi:hypothetical protein BGZ73_004589 [Actinomortierella ambigua]|nr:hypothetical protein BGZ73_004589 [Actinomortierella ambigua]
MHLTTDEENALKAYLTPELDRLCDADPTMLADYIIALVKNDKLSGDTEDRIQQELGDFMGSNIDSFAASFARVLNSKSYMPKSGSSKVSDPPASNTASSTSSSPSPSPSSSRRPLESTDMDDSADRYGSSKHRRGDSDGSDDEDRNYKHARRSNDDRYRGAGAAPGGGGDHRSNYSPSNPTGDDRHTSSNSYDGRRRRMSNDGYSGSDSGGGSGSYQHGGQGRTFDRRSGGMGPAASREAPIMTSGYRQREGLDQQQHHHNGHGHHGGFGRDQWSGNGNNSNNSQAQMRDGHFGNDWQNQSREDTGGFRGRGGSVGGGAVFGQERRRPRCRDYDQKGYCMRGDQCPFDHGDDRIVVDELPRMPFDMMAGGRPGSGPSMMHGNMPGMPGMESSAAVPPFFGQGQVHDPTMMGGAGGGSGTHGHMDGMASGASGGGPGRFPGAVGNKEKNQLVVENIPQEFNTIDQVNQYFKKFGPLTNVQVDQIARKALIQYATHEEAHAAYSSPEVIFNNRFVKVYWLPDDQQGTIVNTTLPPGGGGRGRGGPGGGGMHGAAGASGAPGSLSTGKPLGPPSTGPPPVLTPATAVFMTAEKAAELEAQRAAVLAKQKQMEEIQKQKELLAQRQQEIQKQMMEKVLNNKNISQEDKDALLKGLKTVAVEVTKEPIVPTYHHHHHATAQAHAALVASVDPQKRLELLKEAERLEKERLDRELEAMTKSVGGVDGAAGGATGSEASSSQADGKSSDSGAAATTASEGAETTAALKAKLAALQAQAAALGLDTHTGGYAPRGRGGFFPRGRGRGAMTWTRGGGASTGPGSGPVLGAGGGAAPYRAFNLDMRNTKVSVQQLSPETANEEALREHFQKFGELESVQLAADHQSATVHFKVRKEAELALQQGARLADGHTLKLSWAVAGASGTSASSSTSVAASLTTSIASSTTTVQGTALTAAAMTAGVVAPTSATGPVVTSAPTVTSTSTDDADADLGDLAYHEDSEDEERSWKR